VSRRAIRRGLTELRETAGPSSRGRIRRPGGGRKRARVTDPTLGRDLEELVEPTTRGDPESPLRWTCKSVRQLAAELQQQGHQASHQLVSELLHELGYSLQANRKAIEGTSHPDRNAQFEYIKPAGARVLADR
jgi:transposase